MYIYFSKIFSHITDLVEVVTAHFKGVGLDDY